MSHAAMLSTNGFNHQGNALLIGALLVSLALHTVALALLHPLNLGEEKPTTILDVAMVPPPKHPAPPPEAPKPPEPPKRTPPPKRVPLQPIKPTTAPVVAQQPPPLAEPVPPPVISVPQKIAEPPTFVAPPPEPPKITPHDIEDARGPYAAMLGKIFAKNKQYPRAAQMRGQQGTTIVLVEIDASGAALSVSVKESSGFDVLDRQALESVKKSLPLPQPPEILRNREFSVLIPMVFRLE